MKTGKQRHVIFYYNESKKKNRQNCSEVLPELFMWELVPECMRVHLHEEARAESPTDVDVIISAGELCAPTRQVEAVHDPGQLLPHVVRRHQ